MTFKPLRPGQIRGLIKLTSINGAEIEGLTPQQAAHIVQNMPPGTIRLTPQVSPFEQPINQEGRKEG